MVKNEPGNSIILQKDWAFIRRSFVTKVKEKLLKEGVSKCLIGFGKLEKN